MPEKNRRDVLATASLALPAFLSVANTSSESHAQPAEPAKKAEKEAALNVGYLEIVTPEVDAICKSYEQLHGVKFSKPNANLGFARTTKLAGGGLLGVRAPLRPTETPVVRPYLLVWTILTRQSKKQPKRALRLPFRRWKCPGMASIPSSFRAVSSKACGRKRIPK